MELNILTICYLIASVTFILGLKMLSNPAAARRGNLIAAAGMTIAIFATIFLYKDDDGKALHNYEWIFAALVIGGIVGTLAAKKVKMTAMPEMVSLFNGMGGACAALISIVEFNHLVKYPSGWTSYPPLRALGGHPVKIHFPTGQLLIILLGLIIGSISFAGSMIAWGKLNGRVKDYTFKGQHISNLLVFFIIAAGSVYLLLNIQHSFKTLDEVNLISDAWVSSLFYSILFLALIYGIMFVLPIGGADMPVVISLLNSFTGVAAACGGFLYNNKAMLTGGILVGAAGTLLTILMCKAMNRSLTNVLIGSFGAKASGRSCGSKRPGAL